MGKKRKLLIHSIVFSPDGVSTAYLYNDIAVGFKNAGYDVEVLTTTPHYNVVESEVNKQPMTKHWLGLYFTSDYHGIKVYHVPQKKFKSFGMRALGFVYWHLISFILGCSIKMVSIIISPSPPLTIGLISWAIAKLKGAKVVYNVQEIYPDLLINQGSLNSGLILSLLKRLELFVYNHSDAITTIDQIFYKTIYGRFEDPQKLHIIPNFVDIDVYNSKNAKGISLNKELFPESNIFKLMYAGNIGLAQDWEPLVQIAKRMSNKPVGFWIVGEGVLKEELNVRIHKEGLGNIYLLPYQPRDTMAAINAYADMHFIFMNPDMDGQGFPSKVYSIMASEKALLVLSGNDTPICNFLQDKDCAYLITENDLDKKVDKVVFLLENIMHDKSTTTVMGENALLCITKNYSKGIIIEQYLSLAARLLN